MGYKRQKDEREEGLSFVGVWTKMRAAGNIWVARDRSRDFRHFIQTGVARSESLARRCRIYVWYSVRLLLPMNYLVRRAAVHKNANT